MDDGDAQRDQLHQALQATSPTHTDRGSVLTGWVVVTEWMDPDGERWLARMHSATLPKWTADGFHHAALYGPWPDPDSD